MTERQEKQPSPEIEQPPRFISIPGSKIDDDGIHLCVLTSITVDTGNPDKPDVYNSGIRGAVIDVKENVLVIFQQQQGVLKKILISYDPLTDSARVVVRYRREKLF